MERRSINSKTATATSVLRNRIVVIPNNMAELHVLHTRRQKQQSRQYPRGSIINDEIYIDVEYDEVKMNNSMSVTSDLNTSSQSDQSGVLKKSIASITRKSHQPVLNNNANSNTNSSSTSNSNYGLRKSKRRRNSGTSSEEERWLTAIESGKLEQVEVVELRKIKDPKLMTARQRAIYDRNNDNENCVSQFTESLIALPISYKEQEKPQTIEEIKKAQLKSQKRKKLADEKREKDKKRTMERLLRKQETKQKSPNKSKNLTGTQPVIRYRHTIYDGGIVQMPPGVDYPLKAQIAKEPPKKTLCAIAGCGRHKVYNCSKTNLPLCSYECYRKNVLSLKQIMC